MSYQTSEEHIVLSFSGKIQCQIWLLHAVVQLQWSKRRGLGPSSIVCLKTDNRMAEANPSSANADILAISYLIASL